MAKLLEAEVLGAAHVAECAGGVPTMIEFPTRFCLCGTGETLTAEEVFEVTAAMTPMRKVRRGCVHATVVTHTCPKCGMTRAFGGPAR